MVDRAEAEAVLFRAGVAVIASYPEEVRDEPGYTIDEDVAWCVQPLSSPYAGARANIAGHVGGAIADATASRRALVLGVEALIDE